MAKHIVCMIDGTDYGYLGEGVLIGLDMEPAGPGAIGTATITLLTDDTYLAAPAIRDKMEVEISEWDTVALTITHRWFGGFVSLRETSRIKGASGRNKLWRIVAQDYNLLLDTLVLGSVAVPIAAADFEDQVLEVVDTIQGTPTSSIDAVSRVAPLATGLPAITARRGGSLREVLQQVMDNAVAADSALRPRFQIIPDPAVPSPLFGGPMLDVYDAALTPSPTYAFSDAPSGGDKPILGEFTRTLDGSRLVNKQRLFYRGGVSAVSGSDPASLALYPNPYSDDGYWYGPSLQANDITDVGLAQAAIAGTIARTAYPRETISFDTDQKVGLTDYVTVTWSLEGLSDELYKVMGVSIRFDAAGRYSLYSLTLGNRPLEIGEEGDDDILKAPVEGDVVPPDVGTLSVTRNVYNPAGWSDVTFSVSASAAADVERWQFLITHYTGAVELRTSTDGSVTSQMTPNRSYSAIARAVDFAGNVSEDSNTVSGTTAVAITVGVHNGGFELIGAASTDADGWTTTGTATTSERRTGVANTIEGNAVWYVQLDDNQNEVLTSTLFQVVAALRYEFSIGTTVIGLSGSTYSAVVKFYDYALAHIGGSDHAIALSNSAITSVQYSTFTAPAGAVAAEIVITLDNPLGGGGLSSTIYLDAIAVVPLATNSTNYKRPGGLGADEYARAIAAVQGYGNGAANRLAYWTDANTLGSDADLTVDANGSIGVGGTASADTKLYLAGTAPSASGAYGIFAGAGLTLAPASAQSAFFARLGGAIDTAAGTIGAAYVYFANAMTKTGANNITTAYSLRLAAQTIGVTNWTVAADGNSYFAGSTKFGASTAPASILDVAGPIATAISAVKTAAYSVAATDSTVLGNTTSGAFTITLPTAVGCTGRQYTIKRINSGANNLTVGTTSSQTIDGATTYVLAAQYNAITVQSDNSNWHIIGKV